MTHDEMVEVIRAHQAGKKIEFSQRGLGEWSEALSPNWNFQRYDYRVQPEPKHVYMNVPRLGVPSVYATRGMADHYARPNRVACVRVEYTEGQFDE